MNEAKIINRFLGIIRVGETIKGLLEASKKLRKGSYRKDWYYRQWVEDLRVALGEITKV